MRKWIYGSLTFIICAAAALLYAWNKPHKSIEGLKARLVSAESITAFFEKDEVLANKQYLSKALLVTGAVREVSANDNDQDVILLSGFDEFAAVQCVFSEKIYGISKGDSVTVAGFCNGYTAVVILDDCKILK